MAAKITAEEASERTGVSRATVLRAIAAGDIAAVKLGRQGRTHPWLIDVASLDRWAAARTGKAAACGVNAHSP